MPPTPPAWAALPNARHIDAILMHMATHHDKWDAAWAAAWAAARDAAWGAAWGAAWAAARDAAWGAARDAAWGAAWAAARVVARDAALALIAWDDVAYILDMPPHAVEMVIHTDTTHHKHAAVLLLPAVIALTT